MATTTVTLSSTPQQISAAGVPVYITSDNYFYYSFGATTPTVWHLSKGRDAINYYGDLGALWVKDKESWTATNLTVTVA